MTDKLEDEIETITCRTFTMWRDYFSNNSDKSKGDILLMINNSIKDAITESEPQNDVKTSKNNCNIGGVVGVCCENPCNKMNKIAEDAFQCKKCGKVYGI